MAFRQSYSAVKKTAEPSTFSGKYSLKRVAGMDAVGKEAYIIPLDMNNGYACIPHHVVKKNGDKGFKDSAFQTTKIACHKFDKNTGEVIDNLPLCCKLAQMEKDRKPEPDDANYRALNFMGFRNAFPVLVLSTSETDPNKKPTLKKLSLNGASFSYLDLAQSSFEKDFTGKIIKALELEGTIEDAKEMDQQELMNIVADVLKHSIVNVSNIESKANVPYVKDFTVIPVEKNNNIGEISGETQLIRGLIKILAGDIDTERANAFMDKYPVVKELVNQASDFITLFNDNVDSFVEEWTDEELQKYYNEFIERQEQINRYKDYNNQAQAEAENDEDVKFAQPQKVSAEDAALLETPKKELAAVGAVASVATAAPSSEKGFDYSSVAIEEGSILNDVEFAEDDFQIDADDLEDDFSDI